MASIRDHNLDDAYGRQQTPEGMADRSRQSVPLADLDCVCWFMGLAPDECCPVDCVRKKPPKME